MTLIAAKTGGIISMTTFSVACTSVQGTTILIIIAPAQTGRIECYSCL
jgi:hypothetical protein